MSGKEILLNKGRTQYVRITGEVIMGKVVENMLSCYSLGTFLKRKKTTKYDEGVCMKFIKDLRDIITKCNV